MKQLGHDFGAVSVHRVREAPQTRHLILPKKPHVVGDSVAAALIHHYILRGDKPRSALGTGRIIGDGPVGDLMIVVTQP
ncbi:hypothetical protein SDC9_112560 [bioreactor metagenome]|uniref:Uncharacterized protein n=1 Tax=bioreactor metagenome TaxID=1076179 RepID=A0A645BR09_9ZZZZ